MEYKIVTASGPSLEYAARELEGKVNNLLNEGWILHGGISQSIPDYNWHFISQAMIKNTANKT